MNPSRQRLEIVSLPNQDSVLEHGTPGLLCCDVWEHAYYLKYRNRRADYLNAWWKVVAWDVVDERLRDVMGDRPHARRTACETVGSRNASIPMRRSARTPPLMTSGRTMPRRSMPLSALRLAARLDNSLVRLVFLPRATVLVHDRHESR